MRKPCVCPTLVPTPPIVVPMPSVAWGWNGNGSFADDIPSHVGTFIRANSTQWMEFGLTSLPSMYMLVINWDPAAPLLLGELYLASGTTYNRVDFVSWSSYAGTEPYGPDTQPWNLVTQPVGDDGTITLNDQWAPP